MLQNTSPLNILILPSLWKGSNMKLLDFIIRNGGTVEEVNEDLKRRRIAEEKQNEKEYQQWLRDGSPGTIADHYGF